MSMQFSKTITLKLSVVKGDFNMSRSEMMRNPIERRSSVVAISNLQAEISEQDLDQASGGTTPVCTPTPFFGCGNVLTASAECSLTGNPCA